MKIVAVDCNYVEPEFATSYLLVQDGRGFFIECNTNYAIPYLIKAAQNVGLTRDQIDGLVITHVHLDHAGGAGLFLKEFPTAKLYAHPRAARHAIDPTKLVASATQVYGAEFMQKTYGEILACLPDRVVTVEDQVPIVWDTGKQKIKFQTRHLLGHANHHLCVIEPETRTLFSGDSFGVSYPKLNAKRGFVLIPSTSPTGFDGDAAIQSAEWIRHSGMNQIALTHYGMVPKEKIDLAADLLIDQLRYALELKTQTKNESLEEDEVLGHLRNWTVDYFASRNIILDSDDLKLLSLDLKVNAQGIHYAAYEGSSR